MDRTYLINNGQSGRLLNREERKEEKRSFSHRTTKNARASFYLRGMWPICAPTADPCYSFMNDRRSHFSQRMNTHFPVLSFFVFPNSRALTLFNTLSPNRGDHMPRTLLNEHGFVVISAENEYCHPYLDIPLLLCYYYNKGSIDGRGEWCC